MTPQKRETAGAPTPAAVMNRPSSLSEISSTTTMEGLQIAATLLIARFSVSPDLAPTIAALAALGGAA